MTAIDLVKYKGSFTGVINVSDLKLVGDWDAYSFYLCPNGCKSHYARRRWDFIESNFWKSLSPIMHCSACGGKWMTRNDVQNIILKEELVYGQLLDKFKESGWIGLHVSAKEAFRLYTERGCPPDLLEIDGLQEFADLMEQHARTSKGLKAK